MIAGKEALEKEASVGSEGANDLRKEHAKLQDVLRDLALKKEKLSGSREAHEKRQNQILAQLVEPSLKDVDKRHADQLVMAVTTQMAAKDLDKYCKALDTALMRFHSEKVEEINKRIRELWQLIYRGGDIDRVELKAERGTGVSAHTYTYRVVMRKNLTELDMRGRCSAGQKVLASLVIRLALADTFSVNCGVLALDEVSFYFKIPLVPSQHRTDVCDKIAINKS
jgi:DNA repair protein RAD50